MVASTRRLTPSYVDNRPQISASHASWLRARPALVGGSLGFPASVGFNRTSFSADRECYDIGSAFHQICRETCQLRHTGPCQKGTITTARKVLSFTVATILTTTPQQQRQRQQRITSWCGVDKTFRAAAWLLTVVLFVTTQSFLVLLFPVVISLYP